MPVLLVHTVGAATCVRTVCNHTSKVTTSTTYSYNLTICESDTPAGVLECFSKCLV